MNWRWREFAGFSPAELYAVLRLRQRIFVVEQVCAFADCDGKDENAWHLVGLQQGEPMACLRLHAPGVVAPEAVISRVVVDASLRRGGVGRDLMNRGLAKVRQLYPDAPVRIGAQARLLGFYRGLGFEPLAPPYLEDGIVHIAMLKE